MAVLSLLSFMYFWYDTFIRYDIDVKPEKNIPQHLVMYEIDQIKSDTKYWENPRLCCEIGTLYESIYLFDLATKYYLRSIEIAPKNYYVPHFKLAMLNAERNKFDDAIFTMRLIPKINNKTIKYHKGLFWEKLSVQFAKKNMIDEALEANKKAIIYYKSTDTKAYQEAKNEQAFLMMKKSEKLIEEGNLSEAVILLENTRKINDSAELTYRIAILNYGNNNEKAFKYFEKVQNKNPSIINYDIYYELINTLQQEAAKRQDADKERFYRQKAEMLRRYVNNNFLSADELKIENISSTIKKELWGIKKFAQIKFDVCNNTKNSFRYLYAQVDLTINNNTISKTVRVHNNKNIILPYSAVKNTVVNIDISNSVGPNDKIEGKIYLYKNPKFNKIESGKFEL